MSAPGCPQCRERLSDAEAGLVGVWSCLYCEGAWLPASQASALPLDAAPSGDSSATAEGPALQCPKCANCASGTFNTRSKNGLFLFQCKTCAGAFVPRATVLALGDALGGGKWHLGDAWALLVGRSKLPPADTALAVAALLVLLFT